MTEPGVAFAVTLGDGTSGEGRELLGGLVLEFERLFAFGVGILLC